MSECKPITDELMEWTRDHTVDCSDNRIALVTIAKRIDAEHKKTVDEFWTKINAVPVTAENMAEHGWVELPKDANGEYIHIGDVMEWPTTGETFEVVGIGDGVLFYVKDGEEKADWTGASTKRHHQPDTWECIIEDARAYSMNISGSYLWKNKTDELVARCKALAGDAK